MFSPLTVSPLHKATAVSAVNSLPITANVKREANCRNFRCKRCEIDSEVVATTLQPNGMVGAGAPTGTENAAAGGESARVDATAATGGGIPITFSQT